MICTTYYTKVYVLCMPLHKGRMLRQYVIITVNYILECNRDCNHDYMQRQTQSAVILFS